MGINCYENKKRKKSPDYSRKRKGSSNNYDGDETILMENEEKGEKKLKKDKKDKKQNESPKVQDKIKNKSIDSSEKDKKVNSIYDIYDEVLKLHNKVRNDLKHQNLKLNDKITILAQKFADNYDSSEESNFIIDNYNEKQLGINYKIFNGDISKINTICESWINEGNPNFNKYKSKTKHFSQMISKNTREIGIGYSELNNEEKIFIVYYYPAGDILK